MRITETIHPIPPKPPRLFDILGVTEEELRLLKTSVAHTPYTDELHNLYRQLHEALTD